MHAAISLRKATFEDMRILFEWRNDLQTRKASCDTNEIAYREHKKWLSTTLNDPNIQLFIAEENSMPVGTVRADFLKGVYRLSWTVSPEHRGRGIGKCMVAILTKQIKEPIEMEIRAWNKASAKIAEYAGMTLDYEEAGMMYYSRPAI